MQNIRDYRIISLLGEGGMGKVYLAEEETLGRKVAIKVLDHNLSSNPDLIERFKQEARAQANLHHPNIITLHTYFEENGSHCIVLEYVNGMTLKQMIREKGALKENEALEIFYQILDGVG
ncbi:MAG: serine/threonine protein kinase, partial [Ignavibacteriaceae bacterium]|nr:serine/threonine protein kinase [Ignavibacteriaceae bacterium]